MDEEKKNGLIRVLRQQVNIVELTGLLLVKFLVCWELCNYHKKQYIIFFFMFYNIELISCFSRCRFTV